jgi:hypothetical protein
MHLRLWPVASTSITPASALEILQTVGPAITNLDFVLEPMDDIKVYGLMPGAIVLKLIRCPHPIRPGRRDETLIIAIIVHADQNRDGAYTSVEAHAIPTPTDELDESLSTPLGPDDASRLINELLRLMAQQLLLASTSV